MFDYLSFVKTSKKGLVRKFNWSWKKISAKFLTTNFGGRSSRNMKLIKCFE